MNVNTPDYAEARARPGPSVTVHHAGRVHRVDAATMAEAALAVGAPKPEDGERPLVTGDDAVLR